MSETVQLVKDYYGKTLQSGKDLLTDACCTTDAMPAYARQILARVHPEVRSKYYGCGLVLPEKLHGCHILDLGSGAGQDCYILSALVGEAGSVTGVDMTDEQLEVAKRHVEFHQKEFGYARPNTTFVKGYLESLDQLELPQNHFDVIVSNCVINLCENKEAVLKSCYDLLKEGGELYFSDVYADRRVPEPLRKDPVLLGECLSGALYHNDFLSLARKCGFVQPRKVTARPLAVQNAAIRDKLAGIEFQSVTYRLFKLANMEPDCEDYGQAVCYQGTVNSSPNQFVLDSTSVFDKGKVTAVCGNTAEILSKSRFQSDFQFFGSRETHFGPFHCREVLATTPAPDAPPASGSCC